METTFLLERPGATIAGDRRGAGPPVLLLHAGGERKAVWAPVQDVLADAGYEAIALDLRGHGESGNAGADDLDVVAGDVGEVVDRLDAAPVLVGASLGGFAALSALAAGRQDDAAGLVLVDVVPDPQPDRTRAWLARNMPEQVAYRARMEDILGRRDELRRAAAGVSAPFLLVRGGRSVLGEDDVARLHGLVPHLREAWVPDAGHLVARDAPHDLAERLLELLADPQLRGRRIEHFLRRAGAGTIPHPGGDLLSHLRRTAAALTEWGAPPWVVDAAYVHAAYGTDGFPEGLPGATREALVAVVGSKAEHLLHRYGSCDRAASYPTFVTPDPTHVDRRTGDRTPLTEPELRAFAELTIANELDVFAHSAELAERHGAATLRLFESWSPLIGEPARRAVREWRRADI